MNRFTSRPVIIVFAFTFIACCYTHFIPDLKSVHVQRMKIEENFLISSMNGFTVNPRHSIFNFLRTLENQNVESKIVTAFKWQDCGSSSDIGKLISLSVTPDPVVVPGAVGIKFDVDLKEDIISPLKVDIVLMKHILVWIEIPCEDDIGSCTYSDVCKSLANVTCPTPFIKAKVPCKCPFPKGSYSFPLTKFELPKLPSGLYYVKATLSSGTKQVSCTEIYVNFS